MATTTTTETTKITKTENYTETMYTAAFTSVNTDGAPVTRYNIGTNYTYGTHTYSIVGVRKYTGDAHSYWLVRFDSDPTTHELTADKIKDKVGDDRKQIRNGSANNDKSGKAVPVADLDVCEQKARNAYKAELAAIATLEKRFGKRIVSDVAELCELCVDNTANAMFAAAKEKERKAIAAKKETKEFAAAVASNKATIDEIKAAIEREQAKEQPDTQLITALTKKLLALL